MISRISFVLIEAAEFRTFFFFFFGWKKLRQVNTSVCECVDDFMLA